MDLQAAFAGAAEGGVVGKDDVAAALANLAAVGQNLHWPEFLAGNTIWTARSLRAWFDRHLFPSCGLGVKQTAAGPR